MTDDDPFDNRYTDEGTETAEASKNSKSSESSKTAENAEASQTVRSRKNVNMYLPDDLVGDMQLRYSELNVEWQREHGEELPKNAEYYPAVIRAALNGTTVAEELGIGD
jgi:hypothetical protein